MICELDRRKEEGKFKMIYEHFHQLITEKLGRLGKYGDILPFIDFDEPGTELAVSF